MEVPNKISSYMLSGEGSTVVLHLYVVKYDNNVKCTIEKYILYFTEVFLLKYTMDETFGFVLPRTIM